jgi:hypothetical protein
MIICTCTAHNTINVILTVDLACLPRPQYSDNMSGMYHILLQKMQSKTFDCHAGYNEAPEYQTAKPAMPGSYYSVHYGPIWHSFSSSSTSLGARAQPNDFSSTQTRSGAGWSALTKGTREMELCLGSSITPLQTQLLTACLVTRGKGIGSLHEGITDEIKMGI